MIKLSRRFLLGGLVSLAAPTVVQAKQWPVVDGPSYFNKELDQETKKWFGDATSSDDIPCCSTADGFRRGFTYLIGELVGNEVKQVERLMFKTIVSIGVGYQVTVYDVVSHTYVSLLATTKDRVKQPNNPTGSDIVWLGHHGNGNEIFVRCFCLANEV